MDFVGWEFEFCELLYSVCMESLIIIVGRSVHPCWVKAILSVSYFSNFFCCSFLGEFVIAVCEFKEWYLKVVGWC